MTKAEERAKNYCEGSSFEDACMEKPAYIAGYRQAEKDLTDKAKTSSGWDGFFYGQGYKQAKKDLELTYDDICEIMEIREDVLEMDSYENLYEEILKRFRDFKEKKR